MCSSEWRAVKLPTRCLQGHAGRIACHQPLVYMYDSEEPIPIIWFWGLPVMGGSVSKNHHFDIFQLEWIGKWEDRKSVYLSITWIFFEEFWSYYMKSGEDICNQRSNLSPFFLFIFLCKWLINAGSKGTEAKWLSKGKWKSTQANIYEASYVTNY